MDISITDITDIEKEIQIQASAEEIAPHIEQAYKRHQSTIEIPGFRKGKAPLTLIKRIHGETIEYSSLDSITSDVYRDVIRDRNIHPIGEPVLTDIDYKRGESLTFKVKYEIKPFIELKDYKGIPVEKMIHKVTDKEIDDELLRLRKSNSITEPAEIAADNEHVITADVQKLDESGNPIIGNKSADVRLYLAGETLYAEIKQTLLNAKVGDIHRVKIEREHDDHKHTENLEITVKKIEKVTFPELTDELIQKVTKNKVGTVKDFLVEMRKDLENYWSDTSERRLFDTLVGEISRRHEFIVPESIIKGVLDSLIEDVKNQYPNKKLPPDFNEEKFRETNRAYATFQAKWFLIQERIVEAEKILVEDSDYEQLAEKEAPQFGIEKDRLLQFYKSSDSVKNRIVNNKLTAFLKQNAVITEKVTEEPIK